MINQHNGLLIDQDNFDRDEPDKPNVVGNNEQVEGKAKRVRRLPTWAKDYHGVKLVCYYIVNSLL